MGTPSITDPKAKIFVAKNGSFLEKEFLSKEVTGRKVELNEGGVPSPLLESSSSQNSDPVTTTPISEETNDIDHETSDQVSTELRRSTRVRSAPEWYGNPVLEVMLLDHDKPTNYEEAMMSLDSAKWLEALKSEMGSMYENKVWTLVNLPDDRKAVGCRWILKGRRTMMVSVTIKKARFVVKMFFDKFKVLTTMRVSHSYLCLKFVRIMLAIAAFYEIWQMDVKTAFLNGYLKEQLYMMQPKVLSILKVLTK